MRALGVRRVHDLHDPLRDRLELGHAEPAGVVRQHHIHHPDQPHRGGDRVAEPGQRRPQLRGQLIAVAGIELTVLHTPGHAPGAVCLHAPRLGALFSGDTLFCGGPGATGRSYSHFPTIIESIRDRLLTLPGETVVHTGHGDTTTVAAEAPHLEEWIDRGF